MVDKNNPLYQRLKFNGKERQLRRSGMFIEKRHTPFTPHARLKNKGKGEGEGKKVIERQVVVGSYLRQRRRQRQKKTTPEE
jgi:hypothetical protein